MQNIDTQYQEALNYLYSFIDYSLTRNLRYSAEKFNLSRMAAFMGLLSNPQNNYKVIHVAGTKGKGSTSAMLTSILSSAGYKTGFYSSPHMIEFNERIRIGDQQISKQKLVDLVDELKPFVAQVEELTTFEITTGLAFQYFSEEKVDLAVIEVGMGGRLDATNIVSPILSVITSISHDHMKVLGTTLSQIAGEKAGIIKAGVPVIVSPQKKAAEEAIRAVATARGAPILPADQLFQIKRSDYSLEGQYFSLRSLAMAINVQLDNVEATERGDFFIPLIGDHQLENARSAYICVQALRQKGFRISENQIEEGFKNIQWPGRMEVISHNPLIIVDGAHNRDSFRKFKATVDTYLPGKKRLLIFGASEDKEVELMLEIIQTSIDELIITRAQHPRALEGEKIAAIAGKLGMKFIITDSVEIGLEQATQDYTEDSVILAAGSIFIAGAVKEIWKNRTARKK